MKYTCKVTINRKRDEVIQLFDSIENMYKWQESLISFDILEGEKGVDGLKSRLVYDMNGNQVEMIETVEKFAFPDTMIAIYEAKNVWNRCENYFYEEGDDTVWQMVSEFKCKGMMWIISNFMKSNFVKQTQSDMEAFKNFAETAVLEG